MSVENVLQMIKDEEVLFVDFRFTDTRGKEQHVTFPAHSIDEDTFTEGNINYQLRYYRASHNARL